MTFACIAGTSAIGDLGIVGADQVISLEQLVIDNKWLDAYNYVLNGNEVDDATKNYKNLEPVTAQTKTEKHSYIVKAGHWN